MTTNEPTPTFDFSVTDDDKGIAYSPWTDGHAVGYRITYPTGEVRFIYLNPSGDSDGGTPDVFLYIGSEGDPSQDGAAHWYGTSLVDIDGAPEPEPEPMAGEPEQPEPEQPEPESEQTYRLEVRWDYTGTLAGARAAGHRVAGGLDGGELTAVMDEHWDDV